MIELVIDSRRRDLGGFEVGRVLPFHAHRRVGPFVFFDHMGPIDFAPGIPRSVDVRPHPHIGLSTVTYLFEGEITHRDSVGSQIAIVPGGGPLGGGPQPAVVPQGGQTGEAVGREFAGQVNGSLS